MAKKNGGNRVIRLDQFNEQLEETGISNFQEVMLSKDHSIWVRLGNSIDREDAKEFADRMADATTSEEIALVVLDYREDVTAEEQWEAFKAAGGTADRLAMIYRSATTEQQERLGNLRPRRS